MDFISEETVKTRKPHNCWGCTIKFPIGSIMRRNTSVDSGEIGHSYWCEKCTEFIDSLPYDIQFYDIQQYGIAYGELKEYEDYPKED
jgi:hypothetical protein